MKEKIHKVLARAGLGSRREIERWILDDRVKINGRPATLGVRVSADDRVQVDGKPVSTRGPGAGVPNVIMYHKPEGEVCTRAADEKRPTVYRSLPAISNARWVSVGRLDLNTSGLLLFTDDGDLANKLMHPSTGLEREYLVRVRGPVDDEAIRKLMTGVSVDGREARFDTISRMGRAEGQNRWYRVVIREGRNREVRRLWEKVGYQVSRLKRIRYGSIRLPRDMKQGRYAKLAPAQLEKLLRIAGFSTKLPDGGRRRGKRSDVAPIRQSPATSASRRARRRR